MSELTTLLADQLDYHWANQLRPRLDDLTDEEYFWQPVPDCWTVHPDGSIDFAFPEPAPAPFTTIAWRLPTSSSACSRCATTSTSAGRRPTTNPGTTPPTPRPRCS